MVQSLGTLGVLSRGPLSGWAGLLRGSVTGAGLQDPGPQSKGSALSAHLPTPQMELRLKLEVVMSTWVWTRPG